MDGSVRSVSSVSSVKSVQKLLTVDEEATANSDAAYASTRESAKGALEQYAIDFNKHNKTIASSSGTATREMLAQGRIAVMVEKKYSKTSLDAYYLKFREDTDTVSASKWSQYKRIGRVADTLEPYADRLPSGWSVLSSLATIFDARAYDDKGKDIGRKYPFSVEDLLNTPITFTKKKDGGGKTYQRCLNPTSTQADVRVVVNTLLGKENKTKEVQVGSQYRPSLDIIWSNVKAQTFEADIRKFSIELAELAKKYPFLTFDTATAGRAGLNTHALRQAKSKNIKWSSDNV